MCGFIGTNRKHITLENAELMRKSGLYLSVGKYTVVVGVERWN